MDLNILKLTFNNIELARRDIPKIRGFIANSHSEFDELHNHKEKDYIYRYPLVQYKTIDESPTIIGINEGADIIKQIEGEIKEFVIQDNTIPIYEKTIKLEKCLYGVSKELLRYRFISPWMSLNDKNYKIYRSGSEKERNDLLKRILIGNILSMSKSFKYTVTEALNVYLSLTPCKVNFKNNEMIAFKGEFLINFYIPSDIGIGKSVSRGLGTVRLIKNSKFI